MEIHNSLGSVLDELGKEKRSLNENLLSSDAANKGLDSSDFLESLLVIAF